MSVKPLRERLEALEAFADDQLGLMDHLGIHEFFYMGYCIGGCFAGKLLQRAPGFDAVADLWGGGVVMQEILDVPDNIPQELLEKAECVIVIPSMTQVR